MKKRKINREFKNKINWRVLIVSFLIIFLVAYLGSIFTSSSTDSDWYKEIKPRITPPSYVFPIVWNILFIMIALSMYFSWINSNNKQKKKVALVFGINFILNILWSVLYFGMRNPKFAFFEIIVLWFSILSMIFVSRKIDKKAAWLLIPYLLWVGFAAVLNFMSF